MEFNILNTSLVRVGTIDTFESVVWTDRYYGAGDFEIVKSPSTINWQNLITGYYLGHANSEHLMIIEDISIDSSPEKGNKTYIKGRSLESILDRRDVFGRTFLTGDLQDAILTLLNENAINPTDTDRKITKLEFEASTDPIITALTVDTQFKEGDSLYKTILDICVNKGIGFKITKTAAGKFKFKLYAGVDRSHDQLDNPYVVFSPNFDNLINATYKESTEFLRTVAIVVGETGVGNVPRVVVVTTPGGGGTDLDRREMFVDASGISRTVPDGPPLTDEEYDFKLAEKGIEELGKNIFLQTFEGEANTSTQYHYGEHFLLGDLIQILNEYGQSAKSRVGEVIFSQDPSGIKTYPTFSSF